MSNLKLDLQNLHIYNQGKASPVQQQHKWLASSLALSLQINLIMIIIFSTCTIFLHTLVCNLQRHHKQCQGSSDLDNLSKVLYISGKKKNALYGCLYKLKDQFGHCIWHCVKWLNPTTIHIKPLRLNLANYQLY